MSNSHHNAPSTPPPRHPLIHSSEPIIIPDSRLSALHQRPPQPPVTGRAGLSLKWLKMVLIPLIKYKGYLGHYMNSHPYHRTHSSRTYRSGSAHQNSTTQHRSTGSGASPRPYRIREAPMKRI